MEERTCPYCGNQHRARAAFCPVTGKALPPETPPAPPPAPPAPPAQRTHCYNCNSPVEPTWRICPNCGSQLVDQRLPSAAPTQVPQRYPAQPQPPAQNYPQYPTPQPQPPQAPYRPAPQAPAGYAPQPKRPQAGKFTKKTWLLGCSLGLLGGIALLAVICVAAVLLLGLNENNRTAKMIPGEDTRVFLSFSPTLMQLPSLVYADRLEKSLAIFGAVPGAQDLASVSQEDIFQNLDIDPQRDILPWIGNEVSLAMFDDSVYSRMSGDTQMVSRRTAPAGQYYGPAVLLSAATRSKGASDSFLNKFYDALEKEGARINTYAYEDVDITEVQDERSGTNLAIATYRGMVLLSMDPRVIELAIDSADRPKQSLYQQEAFQDMLKRMPANRLGMMFMDASALMEESGIISSAAQLGMSSVDAIGGSFSLESSGLRFDYLLKYDTASLSDTELQMLRETTSRNALTGSLPGESIFYFSGQDLSLMFSGYMRSFTGGGEEDIEQLYDDFRTDYNVDLKAELLDNMKGEYAIFFLPVDPGASSNSLPAGMAMAMQLANTDQVQRSLRTLMQNIANESGDRFSEDEIDGNPVFIIRDDYDSEFTLGTAIRDNVLYLASTEDILETLAASPKPSLSSSPAFSRAIRALPNRERFYFVVDVAGVKDYAYSQMDPSAQRDFDEDYASYIEDLESLGFSVGKLDNAGIMHGQMRVNTK